MVHSVGGITALAMGILIGPRIGKYTRDGKPNAILGHDIVLVLTGCFILAFGWFGFNPGSTLGASGNGNLRIGSVAVNTMLAGMTGSFGAMLYMWMRYGKPDASMSGNGLLAGLVAITAPSGFVNPVGSVIIGLIAGVLVCLSVEFVDRVMKVDDPVGAISVHGTNGLWGVISVGLFADGKSNYGGSWNGVNGNVTGLFYGDAGQLVAQLIGVCDAGRIRVHLQLRRELDHRLLVGQRSAKAELEGLDMPEMGALGYPEFELKASHDESRDLIHVNGSYNRLPGTGAIRFPVLPSVPWRDPHTVSPEELAQTIRILEAQCLENPQSADLQTCLGMAYAMNFDAYKSMDALEEAWRSNHSTSSRR